MKYGIKLISKYTGDLVAILGSQYDTSEEAYAEFEMNCCARCNRMELVYVREGMQWKNRQEGFVEPIANTRGSYGDRERD